MQLKSKIPSEYQINIYNAQNSVRFMLFSYNLGSTLN